jgi:hypothetical protein
VSHHTLSAPAINAERAMKLAERLTDLHDYGGGTRSQWMTS